ncbi:MAG: 3-hydroxyacyl-CoA dehydrogenase family protein [Candidatus Bathyarchaeia archaeon]
MEIKKVAVIGAGLMGHGIAQVAAQVAKFDVVMLSRSPSTLDKAMAMIKDSLQKFHKKGLLTEDQIKETLNRIRVIPLSDLDKAIFDADLIIETIAEDIQSKKNIFSQVDRIAKPEAILATNTSSLSITELASSISRPERFCGMHFFNPPQIMRLVEIIRGARTSDETINTVAEAARRMGKEPVIVKKDCVGFIVNRILMAALNEALHILWEGVAERDDIDKACELGLNWPMGPLKLLDYIGLDTALAILEVLEGELDPKFRPSPLLRQMIRAGFLGKKTGKGFYEWSQIT